MADSTITTDFQPVAQPSTQPAATTDFQPVGEVKKSPYQESISQAPPKSTWGKVMDLFGPDKEKESAKASNAMVYSEMLGIRPSTAYKYHDEISEQVKNKMGGSSVELPKGYGAAAKAGLSSSIAGMMYNQKAALPFESPSQMERWINGFLGMAPDIPVLAAGYVLGGGTPVTGTAGALGLDAGIRRTLVDRYNKGEVKDFGDFAGRFKSAAMDTIKGEVTGAATGAVGSVSPIGMKALTELATITTVGKLVEGQLPTAEDFKNNAGMLLAMGLGFKGAEAAKAGLEDVFVKTGKHPADVVTDIKEVPPTEKPPEQGLRPAIKTGSTVITGAEGETHADIFKNTGTKEIDETGKPIATRGFVDPDGNFLNRKQAEGWTEKNEPDVHEVWKSTVQEGDELHAQPYADARDRVNTMNTLMNERGAIEIDIDPAIQAARRGLEKLRAGQKASRYGEALRTFFTGQRDSRIAETNQFRDELAKMVPDYQDQEALSLMRDFKNKPGVLEQKKAEYEAGDNEKLKKLLPIIDKALNPTDSMKQADVKMTDYFEAHLEEGKRLGFLDSSLSNDEYITHLLEPEPVEEGGKGVPLGKSKIGRGFQFSRKRKYETILDALENPNVRAKTINALDALTIYGDKHATAAATKLLTDELKQTDMGKWGFSGSDNRPRDWVPLAPGRKLFTNSLALVDKETGEAHVADQSLYVPPVVADALRPIIEPSSLWNVPGFRAGRVYQTYIKAAELGLSVFHMKAMNIAALGNEKLSSVVKSYASDMDSPAFKDEEIDMVRAGGTTSILGRTIEAYRAAKPSTFPSRIDLVRQLPGIKQIDQIAEGLTHETFDVIQRKFKVMDYSLKKAAWVGKHPGATPEQLFDAKRSIAKEVNAVYGGLQWENLGWSKTTQELSKAILLAPDWTFSNVFNLKYAFGGGPAGVAARKFWIKSAITGVALTQAMSLLTTGQPSKYLTDVYLGQDKTGKDIYSNMFFAGAPKDFLSLLNNVKDYGAIEGIARSVTSKLGPIARTAGEAATNRDWMGRPIVKKGSDVIAGTVKSGENIVTNLAPIPFSVSNVAKMLTDKEKDYGFWDYASVIGGSPPRRESPNGPSGSGKRRARYRAGGGTIGE